MFALTQRSFSKLSLHSTPNLGPFSGGAMHPHTALASTHATSVGHAIMIPCPYAKMVFLSGHTRALCPCDGVAPVPYCFPHYLVKIAVLKRVVGWGHMAVVPALGRQRPEDLQVEG